MSAEATFWAWEQVVTSSQKLALLALANCHNESNGQCNPSISYICRRTHLDRKTVMAALKELEALGVITKKKSSGTSTQYKLNTSTYIGTTPQESDSDSSPQTSTESGTSTKNNTGPESNTSTSPENDTGAVPKTAHKSKKNLKGNLKYKEIDISKGLEAAIDRESLESFITHRIGKKAKLTQRAFDQSIDEALKASVGLGITPTKVIDETVLAGWQGVNEGWLSKRLGIESAPATTSSPASSAAFKPDWAKLPEFLRITDKETSRVAWQDLSSHLKKHDIEFRRPQTGESLINYRKELEDHLNRMLATGERS